jgi:hypothetical protein
VIGKGQGLHALRGGRFREDTRGKIERSAGRETGVIVKVGEHGYLFGKCSTAAVFMPSWRAAAPLDILPGRLFFIGNERYNHRVPAENPTGFWEDGLFCYILEARMKEES